MALSQSELSDLLDAIRAGGDLDVIRRSVEMVLQALIDAELTEVIGADRHERTPARTNQRNGTRDRLLSTKAGDVELKIPKLRAGSFFPAVLERRRRIDRALFGRALWDAHGGQSPRTQRDFTRRSVRVWPGGQDCSTLCYSSGHEPRDQPTRAPQPKR